MPRSLSSVVGWHRPRVDRQVLAHPLDEHGHLVGDQANVGTGRAEHGQTASLARGGYEQESGLHLDDGLPRMAAAEVTACPPPQALKAGPQSAQVVRLLTAHARRAP